MKAFLIFTFAFFGFVVSEAQTVSLGEISRRARFDQQIDELNNGKTKIDYSSIHGIPYYYPQFINAKIGDTKTTAPIRYNSFLDTVELVNKENVYQLPRDESSPKFTFETTKEKLVFVKTEDIYSGYFIELTSGKYRILKKIITKYLPATPAQNSLIAGTEAMFTLQKPLYFLKTDEAFFKIERNGKEVEKHFPERAKAIAEFIDKNNLKLNEEEDLQKLGNFLNQ